MRDPYLYPDSEALRNLTDIYDVDMLKNMEADYCSFRLSEIVVDDIAKDAKYVLSEMNAYDWQTASFENIAMSFSNYMAKLWKIHLYREGNTRTIVCSLRHREFTLRVICLRIMPLICAQPW